MEDVAVGFAENEEKDNGENVLHRIIMLEFQVETLKRHVSSLYDICRRMSCNEAA